jgi:hypothetical protein
MPGASGMSGMNLMNFQPMRPALVSSLVYEPLRVPAEKLYYTPG